MSKLVNQRSLAKWEIFLKSRFTDVFISIEIVAIELEWTCDLEAVEPGKVRKYKQAVVKSGKFVATWVSTINISVSSLIYFNCLMFDEKHQFSLNSCGP